MNREALADIVANEWLLVNGWTPAGILQEHYASMQRRAKVASEKMEAAEARVLSAGVTLDFVKGIAEALNTSLGSVVELMKDSRVVKFFSKIGWSFKKLYDLLKKGYHAYRDLRKVMAEYLANTKVFRWTTDELKKLDEFFSQHPTVRRLTGIALAGLLLYIWFNEAYIGDPDYDFDVRDILGALAGSYSFADIFGGPDGATMLTSLLIGTMVSFPWPGATSVHFIASIIGALGKRLHLHFRKEHPEKDEKVPALVV
jgi:hypothetical protein